MENNAYMEWILWCTTQLTFKTHTLIPLLLGELADKSLREFPPAHKDVGSGARVGAGPEGRC